jgi:hypothetical protein
MLYSISITCEFFKVKSKSWATILNDTSALALWGHFVRTGEATSAFHSSDKPLSISIISSIVEATIHAAVAATGLTASTDSVESKARHAVASAVCIHQIIAPKNL